MLSVSSHRYGWEGWRKALGSPACMFCDSIEALWGSAVLSLPSSSSSGCHRCSHHNYLCLPLPCVPTALWHVPKCFGQKYLGPVFLHGPLLILLWFGSVCHNIPSRRLLEEQDAEEWAQQLEGSNIRMYFFAACHRRSCSTSTCEWEASCSHSYWYNHWLVNPTALESSPQSANRLKSLLLFRKQKT